AMLLGEAPHARRKVQALEARHLVRNHTEREGDRAALAETVDAEARQAFGLVREVELTGLVEVRAPGGMRRRHRLQDEAAVVIGEWLVVDPLEPAVVPDDVWQAHPQGDVARAQADGGHVHFVKVQSPVYPQRLWPSFGVCWL